jgi:hypothetical protein
MKFKRLLILLSFIAFTGCDQFQNNLQELQKKLQLTQKPSDTDITKACLEPIKSGEGFKWGAELNGSVKFGSIIESKGTLSDRGIP